MARHFAMRGGRSLDDKEAGAVRKIRARLRALAAMDEARAEDKKFVKAGRARTNACEVCGVWPDAGTVFDHSHAHGHFRGWLCHHCNVALGMARDNPEILRKLAAYLEADERQRLAAKEGASSSEPLARPSPSPRRFG